MKTSLCVVLCVCLCRFSFVVDDDTVDVDTFGYVSLHLPPFYSRLRHGDVVCRSHTRTHARNLE